MRIVDFLINYYCVNFTTRDLTYNYIFGNDFQASNFREQTLLTFSESLFIKSVVEYIRKSQILHVPNSSDDEPLAIVLALGNSSSYFCIFKTAFFFISKVCDFCWLLITYAVVFRSKPTTLLLFLRNNNLLQISSMSCIRRKLLLRILTLN